ncbi:MAG: hypothetical protein Q9162_004122 [Coniocarpon cinnabarinum]
MIGENTGQSNTPPARPSVPRAVIKHAAVATSACLNNVIGILTTINELLANEPPIPPGQVRVRWTCKCGSYLYDDFVENTAGAADRLQVDLIQMNQRPGHQGPSSKPATHMPSGSIRGTSAPSRSGSSGASSVFSAGSSTPSSATSSEGIGDLPSNESGSGSSKQKPRLTANGGAPTHLVPWGGEADVPWLLACCAEARRTPKLTHLSMDPSTVTSDYDVATALRRHYDSIHTGWRSLVRLRGLKSIDFVKFEVHRNRFTDIRARPHLPPFCHPSSFPGYNPDTSDSVSWEQTTDYMFEPGHLVPPVGPHYLRHLFEHPRDYDTGTITLNRIPKKLGGRLEFGVGWGVELVEGFITSRLWAVVFVLMAVSSATFTSVWLTRGDEGDVQGAFAVAGWAVACIGVFGWWIS